MIKVTKIQDKYHGRAKLSRCMQTRQSSKQVSCFHTSRGRKSVHIVKADPGNSVATVKNDRTTLDNPNFTENAGFFAWIVHILKG